MSGLRRDMQDQVVLYEYSTVENVFTLALGIEIQLKRKRRARKSYSPNHYFSHSWKGKDKKKHDKFPSNSHQEPPCKSKSPSDHIHHSTSQRLSSTYVPLVSFVFSTLWPLFGDIWDTFFVSFCARTKLAMHTP